MGKMKNKLKEFTSYIESIGAKKDEKWTELSWQAETTYGPLRISLWDSDFTKTGGLKKKKNNFVSIFTSFQGEFWKVKPYLMQVKGEEFPTNSKVNYHLSGGNSIEENWDSNFERFKNDLDKILVKV